jgi:FtsH-binding integral membrane protein
MSTHSHEQSQPHSSSHTSPSSGAQSARHYWLFGLQLLVSGIIMYLVMFLMIASLDNFHNNINMTYMTLAMVAPMGVVMMLTMPSMLGNRTLNIVLYVAFGLLFVIGVWFTRAQTFIGDEQFLRSMIPHHSGALLMCNEADISDPEIVELCGGIVRSQQAEIDQMEAILQRL